MSATNAWAILTGEYPPRSGGVADYTRQLARALSRAGDVVDVWAPSRGSPLAQDDGVAVHALPDAYGPRSLARLGKELAERADARVLLQYVPHGFGMHGMNVPFCAWLALRRRPVWVMFHEVAFPLDLRAPLKHQVLGLATHGMAAILARRADRIFVSTPGCTVTLGRVANLRTDPVWLPIPSSLTARPPASVVAQARRRLGIGEQDVTIGSFGTYGSHIAPLLRDTLAEVLTRDPSRVALLMGRGSAEFADRELRPRVGSARVLATGALEADELAALLAGCTLTVQPYADGVTTRRTTVMASLALGVPVVTNDGELSESVWREGEPVALAASPSPGQMAKLAESLLGDDRRRAALGARGQALYERRFSIESTVGALRGEAT